MPCKVKVIFNSPVNFYTSSELLTIPIGLAYIKGYCESNFDCTIEIVPAINESVIREKQPDIIGISCFAATFGKAKEVARIAHFHGIPVVVGGEQITSCPELLTEHMTVGVRGEGEEVFLKLLENFDSGWRREDLSKIEGAVYREADGNLRIGYPAKLSMSLDELPIPDFLDGDHGTDLLCLMSSRGCPFKCIFCATGWHSNLHWHSTERIVEIIEYHLKKYPKIRRVKFWDDLFTIRLDRVRQIVELIEVRELNKRLSFFICTRADHINEKLLFLLKRMNCNHVSMGLESGCDRSLSYIRKGCTVETNRNAVALLHRHGFNSEASFIVGFPDETDADIRETYRFIKSIPITKIQIFLPIPYPGTRLWDDALKRGLVSTEMNWERLDLIATMADPRSVLTDFVILSKKLSRKELYDWLNCFKWLRLIKTFKYALRLVFEDPTTIVQRLKREMKYRKQKNAGTISR